MLNYEIVPVTPYVANCCIVWCDQTLNAVVIDPGGDIPFVLGEVQRLGVQVEQVWLTHGHIDHVSGAAQMARELDIPIYGPQEADLFLLNMLDEQTMYAKGWSADAKAFVPTRWLYDMDTLSVGNEVFTVRHCPGHTPGHVVYHSAQARRVFVGDVLFAGSVGRTDLPQGNHEQLVDSIVTKLWPMGNDTVFIPGHGPEGTLGQERRNNPYVGGT